MFWRLLHINHKTYTMALGATPLNATIPLSAQGAGIRLLRFFLFKKKTSQIWKFWEILQILGILRPSFATDCLTINTPTHPHTRSATTLLGKAATARVAVKHFLRQVGKLENNFFCCTIFFAASKKEKKRKEGSV